MIRAIDLARSALGIDTAEKRAKLGLKEPAKTAKADADRLCFMCEGLIEEGESYLPKVPFSSGFMDGPQLNHSYEGACLKCISLMPKPVMDKLKRAIITQDEILNIFGHGPAAYMLLNPPKPPFTVIYSLTNNSQHLIWKAPVTLDPDLWQIQAGDTRLTVDRKKAIKAAEICGKIAADNKLKGFFPFMDRDPLRNSPYSSSPSFSYRKLAAAGETEELKFLSGLGPGELWALTFLSGRLGENEKPERISITPQKGKAKKSA